MKMGRLLPILLVAAFLLLRFDFWWPDEAALALGLPVSLLYHALYCVAAAGAIALLGRYAWRPPEPGP
jgi:hypothetical protein